MEFYVLSTCTCSFVFCVLLTSVCNVILFSLVVACEQALGLGVWVFVGGRGWEEGKE